MVEKWFDFGFDSHHHMLLDKVTKSPMDQQNNRLDMDYDHNHPFVEGLSIDQQELGMD